MQPRLLLILAAALACCESAFAADSGRGTRRFWQEIATRVSTGNAQLIDISERGVVRAFVNGEWFNVSERPPQKIESLAQTNPAHFVLAGPAGTPITVPVAWREVRQIVRLRGRIWVASPTAAYEIVDGKAQKLDWPATNRLNQIAVGRDGLLWAASNAGLFRQSTNGWTPVEIKDAQGRIWSKTEVLGVALDANSELWFATKAGVGTPGGEAFRFYEGKDGLPYNDFTGIFPGPDGPIWFGTKIGAIRFDRGRWHYRQGPGWLTDDHVRHIAVDTKGTAWIATPGGVGKIEFRQMTLATKAAFYEREIEQFIKRTPYGFVAEASLQSPGDRSTARQTDSDNDGLWTAMYGAGQCFAYAATKQPEFKERARQAFEALRFLQVVTQGGPHSPPKGYIARTILPADGPDPNIGRLERDRQEQKRDRLWKVYEPRWPKSADGKWYWKSDTSSDELDGHYFFYPLYYEFCADTDEEKERVREVVRGITDHLIEHDFNLVDHDGRPTRWGIYSPKYLNHDPDWWGERGLKSLSILSYLAGAAYITGDAKYDAASRELIDKHGYAQNLMFPKVQHGPGSGNQSDDEMAVMCFYTLLRYSRDEKLKAQARYAFYRYWVNEAPEMNPFFNFAYAAHNRDAKGENPWGEFSIAPWPGWQEDAMSTLYSFQLDRVNWSRRNSHRLDIQLLTPQASVDLYEPRRGGRGHRVNGKVLPVENRYFTHWNTDPWRLDYNGRGDELGAGTVFLLPYYMGLFHGFID